MALENGTMSPADIAAVTGNNGWGNDGFGGWWVMWFLLIAMMGGGWNNGWGGGGNNAFVPYIGATADVQRGFDQSATIGAINNLSAQVGAGFADNALANCQGNANTVAAVTGAKDAINATLYANQLANNQTLNSLAMSLQNCCCENRSNVADLKYTVATENCADRQAVSDGLRDLMAKTTADTNAIIQSQTAGFQALQDKLCQLEIDGLKQANETLRTQLNMAALAASQTAQTSQIVDALRVPAPIPAYTVPNPFTPTTTTAG